MQILCIFSHIFRFFHVFFEFWAHLSHSEYCCSPDSVNYQQIFTGKQHVKAVEVFRETAISDFDIAEILLDNQERMFRFATGCRLTMLNLFFPVYTVIRNFCLHATWTTVNDVFNLRFL